jgi:hypothetical protein
VEHQEGATAIGQLARLDIRAPASKVSRECTHNAIERLNASSAQTPLRGAVKPRLPRLPRALPQALMRRRGRLMREWKADCSACGVPWWARSHDWHDTGTILARYPANEVEMTHRPAVSGRRSFGPLSRSRDTYCRRRMPNSRRRRPNCNIVATGCPDCDRRRRSIWSRALARRAAAERKIGTKSLCAHSYKGIQEPVASQVM